MVRGSGFPAQKRDGISEQKKKKKKKKKKNYPRDLAGYGRNPPDPRWPGGARVALQFVMNFEEGGENSILTAIPPPRPSSPTCSAPSPGAGSAT